MCHKFYNLHLIYPIKDEVTTRVQRWGDFGHFLIKISIEVKKYPHGKERSWSKIKNGSEI